MKLIELTEQDKEQYTHFAENQESGSFLQSWEWGQWQESLGREVKRFKIEGESQEWLGSVQLVKMALPLKRHYWYAPYGPVISESCEAFEVDECIKLLKQKFIGEVFIRIEPKLEIPGILQYAKKSFFNVQPGSTLVLNLEQPEEQLLEQMHHKTRYNIRLAEKRGVKIEKEFAISAGHGLFYKETIDLIIKTAERRKFRSFGRQYYDRLVNFFALHHQAKLKLHLYKAVYKDNLLSSSIMIDYGKTRTYLVGGSSLEYKNVMAPFLMHFRAFMDAKQEGLGFYDFWGTETSSGKTPGFVRFKLGFGGGQKKYPGAYDIVLSKKRYGFYQLVRFLNRLIK